MSRGGWRSLGVLHVLFVRKMMENMSATLKKYRMENDLSLVELAKQVGVSHTTIHNVENGMLPRNERTRYKIAKFLQNNNGGTK